jgi:hypothetical protein
MREKSGRIHNAEAVAHPLPDAMGMTKKSLARLLGAMGIVLWSSGVAHAASITFAWDTSSDPAIAGYVISWGTQSGRHTQSLDVGKVNIATVTAAVNEQMLYVVVRAYNASRQMSAPSNEAAAWLGTVWRTPSLLQMGDFDGDGRADPTVYRGSTGVWYTSRTSAGQMSTAWGAPALGDVPVAADYDGDGKSDVAVYRSTTGQWFISQSKGGSVSLSWGSPALLDLPVPADYDGDNRNDVAVFRRTTGEWLIRLSTTGQQKKVRWGAAGNDDAPVPGDYDGNGVSDIAVFRRSTGQWFVLFDTQKTATWSWGSPANVDIPVPADYDGDGTTDIGVFRSTTGTWLVHLSASNGSRTANWGAATLGDVPVPADYDGDGSADFAVFRASTGAWYLSYAKGGSASFGWGAPAAGDTVGGMRESGALPAW